MKNLLVSLTREPKIIKTINIASQQDIIGLLLYIRNITPTYRLIETEQKDNIELYPYQKMYPTDELDEILLEAIIVKYPKSNVHNSLLMDQSDIDKINILINRPSDIAAINIKPNFSQAIGLYHGLNILGFKKEIAVYADGSPQMIKNLSFWGQCDFNRREEIYKSLDKIVFL